jgi:hypothetical protein
MQINLVNRAVTSLLSIAFLTMVAILSFAVPVCGTMTLQTFNANANNRFNNHSSFIGNPYDWSGVGRGTSGRWGVMISPSYFLSANHFAPSGAMRFYETNNSSGAFEDHNIDGASPGQISFTIGSTTYNSDLWLGKLTTPVSSAIAKYPILDLPTLNDYDNRLLYTFGLNIGSPGSVTSVLLGQNRIDPGSYQLAADSGTTGVVYLFDYDNPGGVGASESRVENGDSGGPSFNLAMGSIPALVGIHWFQYEEYNTPGVPSSGVKSTGSGDTFVPWLINEIQAEMTGGETLTLIPEPNSVFLALSGIVIAVLGRRRKSRQNAA